MSNKSSKEAEVLESPSTMAVTDHAMESEPANRETEMNHRHLKSWQLAAVTCSLCLGTFLMALDINIIGVAVPKIATVFGSLEDSSWYAAAYLLTVTAFQPIMGSLYKHFPVRAIYLSNIAIFEVGSIICAVAPSSPVFILGRAVAGLGAAGLLQGALSIITAIVALERRPMFMGIVISVFGLSICIGPTMGGAFVNTIGWRWCFWINLPIGAVASGTLLAFLHVRETQSPSGLSVGAKLRQLDVIGTILFLGLICCLVIALQWGGQTMPWSSPTIIGLLVTSGILTIVFCYTQWRGGERALIPVRLLRMRTILVGVIFLFFTGMFNYTYSFYLPFYFQAAEDVSPVISGVRVIAFMAPQMVFIGLAGYLVSSFGHYMPYMIVGMIVCAIGTGFTTRINSNTPATEWATYLVIAGAGLGTANQLPYTALQIVLSEEDVPIGNALFVFFNQLGGMIAIPVAQALFLSSLRQQLPVAVPGIDPNTVITAGPANLHLVAGSSDNLLATLKNIYSNALHGPFILGLAAVCAASVCVVGMEWKNVKVEAERRRVAQTDASAGSNARRGKADDQPQDEKVAAIKAEV